MVTLGMLWMPIVISAVVVFFASFVFWMVLPHHKSDWKKLPEEDAVLQAMRKERLEPGMYMIPYCSDIKQMEEPLFVKKQEQGPVGVITLRRPGKMAMGPPLTLSFLYNLGVAIVVAYLAGRTLSAGTHYLGVFRVAGTATFLAYAGALFYPAIWVGRPWSVVFKDLADSLVYALLTAGIFGWLWPR